MNEPILAANSTWFTQGSSNINRASITEIEIKDTYTPSSTTIPSWDASAAKDGSVMAYVEGTKLIIAGNGYGKIYANPDSSYAFSDTASTDYFNNVTILDGASLLDTSRASTMLRMFYNCSKIKTVDVSNWDTGNVTTMQRMFSGAVKSSLESLDVSNWDTSEVTDMSYMFDYCVELTELDVSKWQTGKVTTFKAMFQGSSSIGDMKIKNLAVENWDTSSATNMQSMFYGCGQLTKMNLSKWDVSKVTTMNHMFTDCFKIESYNFSGWNTESLTDIGAMFNDNRALTFIDVSDFKASPFTKISQVFESCGNLFLIKGLEQWDVSRITSMQEVFGNCGSLKSLDLSSWDTSSVKQLVYMFRNCSNLETIYVSEKWSTDALETGAFSNGIGYNDRIFEGCSKLVGSNNTAYADNHIDYSSTLDDRAYAQIDNEDGQVGYLTDANINMVIKNGSVYKIASAVRHINGSIDKYNPSEITNAINEVGSEVNAQSVLIEQIIMTLEDKAAGGTAEPFAFISVAYPERSICTCTDGVETLTAKNTDGTYVFCVPHKGEWIVTSTDLEDSTKTKSQIVEITEEGQFESMTLSYRFYVFKEGSGAQNGFTFTATNTAVFSLTNDKIIFNTNTGQSNIICAIPAINLKGYSNLNFELQCTDRFLTDWKINFGVGSDTPQDNWNPGSWTANISNMYDTSRKIYSIDISDIVDSQYVKLHSATVLGEVYNIWLE